MADHVDLILVFFDPIGEQARRHTNGGKGKSPLRLLVAILP